MSATSHDPSAAAASRKLIFLSVSPDLALTLNVLLTARSHKVVVVPLPLLVGRAVLQRPDLVVCDLGLQEAAPTLKRLRGVPELEALRVLLIGTAAHPTDQPHPALLEHAAHVVLAPFTPEQVAEAVDSLGDGPGLLKGDPAPLGNGLGRRGDGEAAAKPSSTPRQETTPALAPPNVVVAEPEPATPASTPNSGAPDSAAPSSAAPDAAAGIGAERVAGAVEPSSAKGAGMPRPEPISHPPSSASPQGPHEGAGRRRFTQPPERIDSVDPESGSKGLEHLAAPVAPSPTRAHRDDLARPSLPQPPRVPADLAAQGAPSEPASGDAPAVLSLPQPPRVSEDFAPPAPAASAGTHLATPRPTAASAGGMTSPGAHGVVRTTPTPPSSQRSAAGRASAFDSAPPTLPPPRPTRVRQHPLEQAPPRSPRPMLASFSAPPTGLTRTAQLAAAPTGTTRASAGPWLRRRAGEATAVPTDAGLDDDPELHADLPETQGSDALRDLLRRAEDRVGASVAGPMSVDTESSSVDPAERAPSDLLAALGEVLDDEVALEEARLASPHQDRPPRTPPPPPDEARPAAEPAPKLEDTASGARVEAPRTLDFGFLEAPALPQDRDGGRTRDAVVEEGSRAGVTAGTSLTGAGVEVRDTRLGSMTAPPGPAPAQRLLPGGAAWNDIDDQGPPSARPAAERRASGAALGGAPSVPPAMPYVMEPIIRDRLDGETDAQRRLPGSLPPDESDSQPPPAAVTPMPPAEHRAASPQPLPTQPLPTQPTGEPGGARTQEAPQALPLIPSVLREGEAVAALARTIAARYTGELTFEADQGLRRVAFRDGDLVCAASAVHGESLVGFLVGRGDVPVEAARSLHTVAAYGRHSAAALIARGLLTADQLWPVLRAHSEWIVTQLLLSTEGRARLETPEGSKLTKEPSVFGGATGAEVLLELLRRSVPVEVALARVGGRQRLFAVGKHQSLLSESALHDDEMSFVQNLKTTPLGVALDEAADPSLACVVYGLTELGALSPAEAPRGAVPSEGPPAHDPLDAAALRAKLRARLALVEEGDYFAILGVSHRATDYDVRRAYETLREELSPTRYLTGETADLRDDLELLLGVVEEAFEVLADDHRRSRYRRAIEATPR